MLMSWLTLLNPCGNLLENLRFRTLGTIFCCLSLKISLIWNEKLNLNLGRMIETWWYFRGPLMWNRHSRLIIHTPPNLVIQDIGESNGNRLGTMLQVADPEDDRKGGEFLRMRIKLDISWPLPRC